MKRFIPLFYFFYQYIFFVVMFFWTIFMGTVIGLVAVVRSPDKAHQTGSFWARSVAKSVPVKVKVSGGKHLTPGQSYVIICNHTSLADIYVTYGWLPLRFRWVMKKELAAIPGVGFASKKAGHIIIDRSDPGKAVETINNAKKEIKDGICVLFFPEGTRSKTGVLAPFKRGAFVFAIDMDLPILPIVISGARDIIPAKTLRLRPGKVEINIRKPIYPGSEGIHYDIDKLMNESRCIFKNSGRGENHPA